MPHGAFCPPLMQLSVTQSRGEHLTEKEVETHRRETPTPMLSRLWVSGSGWKQGPPDPVSTPRASLRTVIPFHTTTANDQGPGLALWLAAFNKDLKSFPRALQEKEKGREVDG